jgi:hypothetical protein
MYISYHSASNVSATTFALSFQSLDLSSSYLPNLIDLLYSFCPPLSNLFGVSDNTTFFSLTSPFSLLLTSFNAVEIDQLSNKSFLLKKTKTKLPSPSPFFFSSFLWCLPSYAPKPPHP